MADGYHRDTAQTERTSRKTVHPRMDEILVSWVDRERGTVMHVEAGRLHWWLTRRRLRRTYGVIATHVDGQDWMLRREDV